MVKNKKILLTGGMGFIGSHLIETFYEKNTITIFDNGHRNAFKFLNKKIKEEVNFQKGDIRDFAKVKKLISSHNIVIHLAAIAGVSSYESDPLNTLEVNLTGTINVLKAANLKTPEKIVIFSTSEVYGPKAHNVSEEDLTPIGPASQNRWSYAVSKIASDHLALAYYRKTGLPVTVVRPFNIYGPRQTGEGAVSDMIKSTIKSHKIRISGNGKQKRSWCYVSDLTDAICTIIIRNVSGQIFNIGNPNSYISILNLANKIKSFQNETRLIFYKKKEAEIADRLPNIEKAAKYLNYNPHIDLNEGLKQTFSWYKENIANV